MPRNYRASAADFQVWLDQPIWVNDNAKQTRREIYPSIADELTEWMLRRGYKMDYRWKLGHRVLAKWVYALACDQIREEKIGIQYPPVVHRNTQEDYDQFHHICGFFEIENLFEHWKTIEDFDTTLPFGNILLHNLSDLLYVFLDLDASKQGRKIAKIYEESESDSDNGGYDRRRRGQKKNKVEDVYLTEARQGIHGGWGSKV